MTLVQLKHFIELAANGSFSKSAERLFLTQPALSRSIKSLEDELGQALFDRVGRKNELTAFGKHILMQAKDLLEAAQNLKHSSQELLSGQTGQVKLGLGSGPGALLMTPWLRHVAQHHPAVLGVVGWTDLLAPDAPARIQALADEAIVDLHTDALAAEAGGELTVSLDVVTPDADLADKFGGPTASCVQITVSDSGVGIPPEVQRRVFEPFFTTKVTEGGTGLGLSTVHGIVEQSGGSVRLQSTVGVGTTFRILLPQVHDESEHPSASAVRAAPVLAGGEAAALVIVEAVARLIPGVLGNADSAPDDSFAPGRADAVLAASVFHYGEMTVHQVKAYMAQHGVGVLNGSPLSMSLLTTAGAPAWHPAKPALKAAGDPAMYFFTPADYAAAHKAVQGVDDVFGWDAKMYLHRMWLKKG